MQAKETGNSCMKFLNRQINWGQVRESGLDIKGGSKQALSFEGCGSPLCGQTPSENYQYVLQNIPQGNIMKNFGLSMLKDNYIGQKKKSRRVCVFYWMSPCFSCFWEGKNNWPLAQHAKGKTYQSGCYQQKGEKDIICDDMGVYQRSWHGWLADQCGSVIWGKYRLIGWIAGGLLRGWRRGCGWLVNVQCSRVGN